MLIDCSRPPLGSSAITIAGMDVEQISQPKANCLTALANMSDLPVQTVVVFSPHLRKTILFKQSFAAMPIMFASRASSAGLWTIRTLSGGLRNPLVVGMTEAAQARRHRLPLGQNDSVAVLLNTDGKPTLYQRQECVGIVRTKVTADANVRNGRILDDDLAVCVSVKVRNRISQASITKYDVARSPAQELFHFHGRGLIHEDGGLRSPRL